MGQQVKDMLWLGLDIPSAFYRTAEIRVSIQPKPHITYSANLGYMNNGHYPRWISGGYPVNSPPNALTNLSSGPFFSMDLRFTTNSQEGHSYLFLEGKIIGSRFNQYVQRQGIYNSATMQIEPKTDERAQGFAFGFGIEAGFGIAMGKRIVIDLGLHSERPNFKSFSNINDSSIPGFNYQSLFNLVARIQYKLTRKQVLGGII